MGDPKKQHKKFSKPGKPWEKERIEEEVAIIKEFGLKNKKEIWKASSKLRNFFAQAKKAISIRSDQGEKEKAQLLIKLRSLGLVGDKTHVEDVLSISLRDILQRRLQSIVFNKGMARTMKQARQFIVHEHILVNGKKITVPGYLVPVSKENTITFVSGSSLSSADHPERKKPEEEKKVKKKIKKKAVKRVKKRVTATKTKKKGEKK
jgi:small subunit ribosomal protein S4